MLCGFCTSIFCDDDVAYVLCFLYEVLVTFSNLATHYIVWAVPVKVKKTPSGDFHSIIVTEVCECVEVSSSRIFVTLYLVWAVHTLYMQNVQ